MGKTTGLSSEPARCLCDNCQWMSDLTAVNLIVLIRMAYKTERLVKLCKIYSDI